MKPSSAEFDIILLGATGYTGTICAEHITTHFPTSLKWAIAGRSPSRLESLQDRLIGLNQDRTPPKTILAGLTTDSIHSLVKQAHVVINGVGPYHRYSEPVVEACAAEGTHYVDFSTETPWIAEMVKRYDELAMSSGAIIIHAASMSSAPPDLLAWHMASKIKEASGKGTQSITASGKLTLSGMQGGSATTVLDSAQRYGVGWLLQPDPDCMVPKKPRPHQRPGEVPTHLGYRRHPDLGVLTRSIVGASNSAIVQRSSYLNPTVFGDNFRYTEHEPAASAVAAIVTYLFTNAAILLLALPIFRALLRRLSYEPGSGPDWKVSAKSESAIIEAIGVGQDGTKMRGKFVWKGSIVHISAMAATEAAGLLAARAKRGDLNGKSGMQTPSFLGMDLIEKLKDKGCEFSAEFA
ncbi:hypothetical protein EJ04DRAFT_576721 [Polyplosphaeria fusca]|uniref:Saccharopine dehydrogenase NADP binding domain-containing protein n=1 Tax=Polyplosphaeria fusca TaxID=682080 RepID=A0A9P4R0V6_9PLEO|nr:hypothetical protein EJ04DRAFT_576721 [Polyplosphaeria fusca]